VDVSWFVPGVLAVWRVTYLLYAEDGPWDLVIRLRRLAGTGFWATLLDCFYCLSLWVALPIAGLLGRTVLDQVLLWPALSAGAVLLERITPPTVTYFEERAEDHVLQSESPGAPRREPDQADG